MKVILHGVPGDNSIVTEHRIESFQEIIIVNMAPIIGIELSKIINPTKPAPPVTQQFMYQLKYHDGDFYHYQFMGAN